MLADMQRRMKSALIRLLILLLGYGLAGWLLSLYNASLGIWLVAEAMILYLAWAGTGAIALSVVGVFGMMAAATILIPFPTGMLSLKLHLLELHLTAAQGWAITLGTTGLLATMLVFKLGFANQQLNFEGFSRTQTFWLLILVTNLGLKLGLEMNFL
jgi:hypothetical protein